MDLREIIRQHYLNFLDREPDPEGLEYYFTEIKNNRISISDLEMIFKNSDEYKSIIFQKQKNTREFNINYFEKKIYSQNGEDGILDFIFRTIETTNKFCIEIGVGDCTECNSRLLLENGWNGLLLDKIHPNGLHHKHDVSSHTYNIQQNYPTGNKELEVNHFNPPTNLLKYLKNEFVTAENIDDILSKYDVPHTPDLLSLDIDYNTYWVWKAIKKIHPRVVVVEYNSQFLPTESKAVEYFPYAETDYTNYYGASLLAFVKLGCSLGYHLVGCGSDGVNAYFICNDIIDEKKIPRKNIEELYKPPQFGDIWDGIPKGWAMSNKEMIDV